MPKELRIVLSDTGQLTVMGPIDDMLGCYGMLELAKDVVRARAAERARQKVAQPSPQDIALLGRIGGGVGNGS